MIFVRNNLKEPKLGGLRVTEVIFSHFEVKINNINSNFEAKKWLTQVDEVYCKLENTMWPHLHDPVLSIGSVTAFGPHTDFDSYYIILYMSPGQDFKLHPLMV